MIPKTAILSTVLASATTAAAMPSTAASRGLTKRWEEGVDCTGDIVGNAGKAGLFFAVDSEGSTLSCDDVNEASAEAGVTCYRSVEEDGNLGDLVKCPGDPAPSKNPDGSDVGEIAGGIIQSYCDTAGGNLAVSFVNTVGCLLFGYYEANGDPLAQAEKGASAVCDSIFLGACTYFTEVAPAIAEGMDRPCIDDPNSNACAFANPGK